MPTYHGTVKGGRIVLPEGVALADGQHVEVRVSKAPNVSTEDQHSEPVDVEEEVRRRLLEAGLLTEIRRPGWTTADDDWSPIEVQGKPVSEIIIEERR